jgi:hypothetical protein
MFRASVISLVVLPLTITCALALAKSAAAPFIVNFTQVDKDGSGDISKSEFEDACAKGVVKNIEN